MGWVLQLLEDAVVCGGGERGVHEGERKFQQIAQNQNDYWLIFVSSFLQCSVQSSGFLTVYLFLLSQVVVGMLCCLER